MSSQILLILLNYIPFLEQVQIKVLVTSHERNSWCTISKSSGNPIKELFIFAYFFVPDYVVNFLFRRTRYWPFTIVWWPEYNLSINVIREQFFM